MIDISGHLRNFRNENGFNDNSQSLIINCCGYQRFLTHDYKCTRYKGRTDYQIIYIHNGSGHFYINNKWIKREKGDIQVFYPNEPQIYSYYANENTEVYWIHFTGRDCDKLLSEYNIESSHIGENIIFKKIFEEIILELQLKKSHFDMLVANDFHKLLICFQRNKLSNEYSSNINMNLDYLILELNQYYYKPWTIKEMADFCNISENYLSHLFQKTYHTTPLQFLTDIRINKAKELLLNNNISISEVAFLLGYSDPLYFSRVFKKREHLSPLNYQKNVLQINTPFETK